MRVKEEQGLTALPIFVTDPTRNRVVSKHDQGTDRRYHAVVMSTKTNLELVKEYYSSMGNHGDLSSLGNFISEDYIDHNAGDDAPRGPERVRAHIAGLLKTFPDLELTVEHIMAEGCFVVTRVSGTGTHTGEWMNIPPTGRKIALKAINIDRVESGKIAEHWGEADTVGMLLQMGANPFSTSKS